LGVNKTLEKVKQSTTGFRQDTVLRNGASTVTPVQSPEACKPGDGAIWISKTLGLDSKG
jgi:hypothetical protein